MVDLKEAIDLIKSDYEEQKTEAEYGPDDGTKERARKSMKWPLKLLSSKPLLLGAKTANTVKSPMIGPFGVWGTVVRQD